MINESKYIMGKGKSLKQCAGKTEQPQAKELNWTTILHHAQKLTQNN